MDKIIVREYLNEYGLKDKWTYKGSTLIKTEMTYPKTKLNTDYRKESVVESK